MCWQSVPSERGEESKEPSGRGEEGVKTIMICQTSVVMTGGDWGTISSRKEDMGARRVLY